MDKLFNKTPASNFAALALAGVMASGYMTFAAGKPVVMALIGGKAVGIKMAAMVKPNTQGSTLGSVKVEPLKSVVQQQADKVANKVEELAQTNQTKNDVVLGDAAESVPVRPDSAEASTGKEEFPPAVNLLRNSSFEEDDNGAPRQWNYQYDSNSGNTKTTLEAIRTGAKGLKVVGGGTGNFGLSQPAAKEIERRDYAFSVWVKPVNTDSHTVKLSFWDEVNNKEAKSKTFSFSGTKEWSRLVFQISNKNTWNGKKWFPMITVNGLGSGALYIEDAQLEEASSFTPYHFTGGGATQSHVSILGDGSVEVDAHGNIYPAVNGVGGLGTGSNKFSELRLTKATIDNNGSLSLDGDLTVNGNGTFKGAVAFDGTIKSNLIPDQDSTYDLGSTTKKWKMTYTNGVYLQNAETIGNGTNGDIDFTDSGTSNVLTMDLNAAADAVELRNDTEDLRLRAAGNGNLVLRAGDGATDSTVNANDIFIASEDDTIMRADTFNLTVSASDAASIALRSTNGGIDLSTGTNSGLGTANLTLRSGGTLKLDTSANNSNILIDSGTGDLIVNVGTHTEVAQDDVVNAISLSASRGGINLSSSNASGNGNMTLKSGGTLALQTSSTNSGIDILAGTGALTTNTGTVAMTTVNGDIVVTAGATNADTEDFVLRVSENAIASTANGRDIFLAAVDDLILFGDNYTLTATNGVNYNVSGADMVAEINGDNDYILRAGDAAREVAANNNDIQLAAEDSMIFDAGDFTLAVSEDAVAALTLNASRGGISISSSNAGGNGNVTIKSAGTLQLDTSATGSNVLVRTGGGSFDVLSAGTGVNAIILAASTGGIDLSTGTNSGLGASNLTLRAGGTLKLDTSANNANILIDSGTGDLIVNVGTHTEVAQDDAVNAIALSASRGGIQLSTSAASSNGVMYLKSAGTLQLDTSKNNTNVVVNAGTGAFTVGAGASTHTYTGAYAVNDTAQIGLTSNQAAINSIALLATNGGIDISTSGVGGLGELRLRSGGSLKLDTSGNNNNILVDSGTGDLLANIGTGTFTAIDDTTVALALRATRGGIELSTGNASGNGNMILKSGGTLQLSTSGTNSNVLLQAGTGAFTVNAGASTHTYTGAYAVTDTAQIGLTSNQAAINSIALLATNGGIDISTSGVGGLGELRLRSGGSLKLDTSGNNNNILVDSGTGSLLENVGVETLVAQNDAVNAIALSASRGGIQLSTSAASSNGVMYLKSAGTLVLDTSAKNTNVVVQAGTGAFTVNAGASTHTYTGAYAVNDTAQIGLTSNQAAINSIALLATNGGIDISTSGVGGLGELRLRAGGSLKLDTSGNNNNILVDSGTGDLLANVGTTTWTSQDDVIAATALRSSRGGIQLSSSNASGNGDMRLLSAGTLQLDTSATSANILANTGAGRFVVTAGGTGTGTTAAIALAATNGGIDLSTSGVNGNGNLTLRSAGTLRLDTTASDTNIEIVAGNDTSRSLSLQSDRGGIDISTSQASGAGNLTLRSAGTLQLDTSITNSAMLMRTGTGTLDISSGLVQVRSANDNLTAIRLLADRGGIEISSGTASGNGNVTIKSAGTLTLDTSANNSNIMVRAGTGRIDLSGNTILVNSGAGTLDLSANNTISIVSSTTARVWGETGTLIGRAGTATRVHGRLCIEGSGDGSTCPAGNDGRLFVNTTGEAVDDAGDVFDLAEYYPASEAVDPGTVVVADSNSRATVKMSRYAYQRVLGVVSTTPAIRINEGSFSVGGAAITEASIKPLIALVGRVPVKVSNENGAIRVGDRLVASTKVGYAMRATKQGMTLGMALEDMSFENGVTEAKVMTFVNVSWYFPEVVEELEKEYQMASAVGIVANSQKALADAVSAAAADPIIPSDPSTPSDPSVVTAGVVAGASVVTEPTVTVATPPTEFPNLAVTKALTVGKELKVAGKATFEGEVEVMADATFGKNVIIVGNLRIGGTLEVAGAVVTNMTAGSSIAAGDPLAVGADGKAYRAGAGKAVIGVAASNAATGEAVKVAVAGKVGNMTGLTTGARYFVNEAGSLTTDGQGGQGLGVAVGTTEMLVQPGVGLPAVVAPVKEEPVKEEVKPVETTAPVVAPTVIPTPVETPVVVPTVVPTETPVPTVTPVL